MLRWTLLLLISLLTLGVYADDGVTVRFTIDEVFAEDLQEDGLLSSDNVDEIGLIYTLQEINANGFAVNDNAAAIIWIGEFAVNTRLGRPAFEPIDLTIAPENAVEMEIIMVELPGDTNAFLDFLNENCGTTAPMLQLSAGNIAIESAAAVECISNQAELFNSHETPIRSPQSIAQYKLEDMETQQTITFSWQQQMAKSTNTMSYDVTYSLIADVTAPPPPPTAAPPPTVAPPPTAAPSLTTAPPVTTVPEDAVILAGDFGSEIGCTEDFLTMGGDWEPACTLLRMFGSNEEGWYFWGTNDIPQGDWEVKVTIGGTWDTNYGLNGVLGGGNIPFSVPEDDMAVFFAWDSNTRILYPDVQPNNTEMRVTLPGDFGREIGCEADTATIEGDWEPACTIAQMYGPTWDDVYVYITDDIPPGDWEVKVAIGYTWEVNYGADGEPDGDNILFTVPEENTNILFMWNTEDSILNIYRQ
jgi:hypothetical protein